ncbi:MAG: hypothetical protein DBY08_04435, partial [Clostridiales bacterium]
MANLSNVRKTLTNLAQPQQLRELNRQLEWIWNQLLGGLPDKAFSESGIKKIVRTVEEVTAQHIQSEKVETNVLKAALAEMMVAEIGVAIIDFSQIKDLNAELANIVRAEIDTAEINGAHIKNASIDSAKIALGSITTALIKNGAIGTAQIADGSITEGKIVSLNADVIKTGTLSVERLLLKGANGLFHAINATDSGLTIEQLSEEQYQNAISGTVIVARSITADKLAAKTITANEIHAGAITTDELAANSVTASKIKAGSITTNHIEANFGNTLDLSSNNSIKLIVGDEVEKVTDDFANIVTRIDGDLESLQGQIDGSITTWFYEVAPTNNNPPANQWTTADDKNIHLGDLYYDTVTGYCYRWQVVNNVYSWQRITDTDVTKALADAAKAQDTADTKRRVFLLQPQPPYDEGDIWMQGANGDILTCQAAKITGQNYASSDWVKGSKYTDDTLASSVLTKANANAEAIVAVNTQITQTKNDITTLVQRTTSVEQRVTTSESKIEQKADSITLSVVEQKADSAMNAVESARIYDSAEPPEEAPEAGKLWLDRGVTPPVMRRWRGADVPTGRD